MSTPLSTVHYSSESAEWYTPVGWLERVVAALGLETTYDDDIVLPGRFDLDPCGSRSAPAARYAQRVFTIEDDGLTQPWKAQTLFMNPPYGRLILPWVVKLDQEFREGNVKKAIALVPARTDTLWWQEFVAPYPVCFVRHRIRFEGDAAYGAPFPSAFVFYNGDPSGFVRVFASHGAIYFPHKRPR